MKARMTQLDLFKVNLSDIEDAYIQNIYYSNNVYYIKLNMRNKDEVNRKRYLNISNTGIFLGDIIIGVNYFAKMMRKCLIRRCIKNVSIIEGGIEIYFHGIIIPEVIKEEEEDISIKKEKPILTKSERRAIRKGKQANKAHIESKNIVNNLLKTHSFLKNIPISDWKNHIKTNTETNTKKTLIKNTSRDIKIVKVNKLVIKISPLNITMYSNDNEILGTLKPEEINNKENNNKENNIEDNLLKFKEREEGIKEQFIPKEVRQYLETIAIFITEKELDMNRFVSTLYELHIKGVIKKKKEIRNYKEFCKKFLEKYILYLKNTEKGTALFYKQESFFIPFEYKNNEIDFIRTIFFKELLEEYLIEINIDNKLKELNIKDKEYETIPYLYSEYHNKIDISIFNTKGKISNINNFIIKEPIKYNEIIKDFFKETIPQKIKKIEKKKLTIKERGDISLKSLKRSLNEITLKMEYLEENTDKFEKCLNFLNINLLDFQIQEIIKRELGFLITMKTRGICELKVIENSFKYEINYFIDLNENLKNLYNKKRKIQLKIKKTIKFLNEMDNSNKLIKKKVKNIELKKRLLFWFEKYKFLISPSFLFIAGKNQNQNEELIKNHLIESEFYSHPINNGPSLLLIKNQLIFFLNCSNKDSDISNMNYKNTAGDFMDLICYQKDSFIVSSQHVSKVYMNEKAQKGAFFINGPKEYIIGDHMRLKLTIGFIERICRNCNKKANVIYPSKSDTSVLFCFYSILMEGWNQYSINDSIENIIKDIKEEEIKIEIENRREEIQSYINNTLSSFI